MEQKIIEKALKYLENTESFLAENVPVYMKEILEFSFYKELTHCLWSVPLLFAFASMTYFLVIKKDKEGKREISSSDDVIMVYLIFGVTPGLIGFTLLVVQILDVIKIKVAPKMYLIEYLSGVANGN